MWVWWGIKQINQKKDKHLLLPTKLRATNTNLVEKIFKFFYQEEEQEGEQEKELQVTRKRTKRRHGKRKI